jgi:hypothetical protein
VFAVYASSNPGPPPWGLVLGLTALVLSGSFALRLAIVRVVLHDDHVELVNPLRRFRFYWSDVEEIDIISSVGWIVRVWAGGVPRWAWGCHRSACMTIRRRTRRGGCTRDTARCVPLGKGGATESVVRR